MKHKVSSLYISPTKKGLFEKCKPQGIFGILWYRIKKKCYYLVNIGRSWQGGGGLLEYQSPSCYTRYDSSIHHSHCYVPLTDFSGLEKKLNSTPQAAALSHILLSWANYLLVLVNDLIVQNDLPSHRCHLGKYKTFKDYCPTRESTDPWLPNGTFFEPCFVFLYFVIVFLLFFPNIHLLQSYRYYYHNFPSLGRRPQEPLLPQRMANQPRVSCDEYEQGSCRWYDEWNYDHLLDYTANLQNLIWSNTSSYIEKIIY